MGRRADVRILHRATTDDLRLTPEQFFPPERSPDRPARRIGGGASRGLLAVAQAVMNTQPRSNRSVTMPVAPLLHPKRWLAIALLGALSAACSSAENDLFDHTRQALAAEVGESCGEVLPVYEDTVDIDDSAASRDACGGGYCLRSDQTASGQSESAGMCTCHCAGEAGDGPFCDCGDDFVCTHLIDQIGLGNSLAGSYCVPQ